MPENRSSEEIDAAPEACQRPHAGATCSTCTVRHTSICDALADDEILALSQMSRHASYRSKQIIQEEGQPATEVANVVSGIILLSRLLAGGRRQVVGIAMPGDFIGLSMADQNAFTTTAVSEVHLCIYPRPRFAALIDDRPSLLARLHESTANELTLAQDHMVLLGRRTASEKVAHFLISLQERWTRVRSNSPRIDIPLTREDMADYLGLTLETVSRTFSRFFREKVLIDIPGGVRVLDPKRLSELARH